jgi:hypothetical protein
MRIRQIVFAAQDLKSASDVLANLFALGTPFPDPGVAEFGIHNAVFAFGDQFIEVISPNQPDTACGRHLARHGDSGYMVLLQTDNFAREKARWADLGVRTIWNTELDNITAAHLHPKDVGGAIVSVDEPRPAASWRWGGPEWQQQPGRTEGQKILGLTLQAPDAEAMAMRWAQVFNLAPPTPIPNGRHLHLDDGFVDILTSKDSTAGLCGFKLSVDEPEKVLAAARKANLPLSDQHFDLLGARITLEPK